MQKTHLACALGIALAACTQEPPEVRQAKKVERIGVMQHDLLRSVEAEKSAVLAVTDQESTAFANESKKVSAEVEQGRLELHGLVDLDARPSELAKLKDFDAAWRDLQAVDENLLALASANTNIKAARLASGECAAAVNQLVDALSALQAVAVDPKVLRSLSSASVSALRIQALLAPHINSPDAAEMTRLEDQMHALGATVDLALADAFTTVPVGSRARMAEAGETWGRYQQLTAEVVRLSRLNTNVLSYDISVHQKRSATIAAQSALSALLTEVQNMPRPTR
jgi:hypothetical protein